MTNEQTSKKVVITKKNNLEEEIKSGGMVRLAGVSETLSDASNIHMAIATIPQDRCSTTHFHTNCESAIYVSKGKGRFLTGPNLTTSLEIKAGDFIYVPQGSVHQPINDSSTEIMELIVSRNTPEEIVEEYKIDDVS